MNVNPSSERLLLSARAADCELWQVWFNGLENGNNYHPPNGILLVEYDNVNVFQPIWEDTKKILMNNKLPIINGACLFAPKDRIISYIRAEQMDGGHLVCPSVLKDGKFQAGPAIWIQFRDDETFIVKSIREVPDKLIEDVAGCMMRFVGAAVMSKRETKTFSLARRPSAAKAGWKGVRYEIADLSRMTRVPTNPLGGTHATPAFHWVLGHFRYFKSGKSVWVNPHHRGDPSKGTVIKDWVRKAGLEMAA